MTSQINPNNIDGTYPVAGQPNNTQGFRDNFTNTKTNFQYASDEITDLQSKAVFKQALTGTTLDNNMNDNLLYAVKMQDVSWTYIQNTATSGSINLDFSAGAYQSVTTTGSVSLSFSNWPAAGSAGSLLFTFNCTNTAYTLTLPSAVNVGIVGVQGISPGTPGVSNTITFGAAGSYTFRFDTADGGTNITMFDFSRPNTTFAGAVSITANTVSTSTTTGALKVAGGAGIEGNLNVGGNLITYASSGNVAFSATTDGFIRINSPTIAANTNGALNLVGSSDGGVQPVLNAGSMIHITGNDNMASRFTNDSFGSAATTYSIMTMRRGRGTATTPSAVQTGDILGRVSASGWGNVGYVLAAGNIATNSMDIVALENHTSANAGSSIQMYTSPIGAVTRTLSANITANVSTFVSVSATGNVISGGNILATDGGAVGYTNGAGGTISQTGNKSTGVTLNKITGEITMQATALAASTAVSFTLTNSTIGARDLLLINLVGGGTSGSYTYGANCTTGSAVITVRNVSLGSLSEALVLRYAVIRGSIA